ncbi:MAG: uracil phosphoribosyltransferase [Myxococcota bacterium]
MQTLVVDHPVVSDRLAQLRSQDTPSPVFRNALEDVSSFLIYEAVRDIQTTSVEVQTPLGSAAGQRIEAPPVVIPVLRAALGMLHAALRLFPSAPVGFLGLRRNEETLAVEPYLHTIPARLEGRPALVLDPMLATGGSLEHACRAAKECDAGPITVVTVLSAPEGVRRLESTSHVHRLVTGAIDSRLNEDAYIVPGLGDAGDRQFNEI